MSTGFLSRWSRRKLETNEPSPLPPVQVIEEEQQQEIAEPLGETLPQAEEIEEAAPVIDLPDINSLTEESDFSAFMQKGVPEELQKLALRKLWGSNPVFANIDGLNDYDEDFSVIKPLVAGVADELMKLMKENSGSAPQEEIQDDAPPEPELMADDAEFDVAEAENEA